MSTEPHQCEKSGELTSSQTILFIKNRGALDTTCPYLFGARQSKFSETKQSKSLHSPLKLAININFSRQIMQPRPGLCGNALDLEVSLKGSTALPHIRLVLSKPQKFCVLNHHIYFKVPNQYRIGTVCLTSSPN